MTETSFVFGRIAAATSSAETRPSPSGFRRVTSTPSASSVRHAARTASCSTWVATTWLPAAPSAETTPRSAQLSLSVPPEVKNISSLSSAPMSAAARSRASSTAALASRPYRWTLFGFPNFAAR